MSGKREIEQGASHGRERASPSRIEERDNQDHDHAGEGGGRKSADHRDDDAHDPAEHAPTVRPGLVDADGQHGDENNQRDGDRATDARLRYRAARLKKHDGGHGNQHDVDHEVRPCGPVGGVSVRNRPRISRKYMPLYVAEFQFRYNNRHNPDIFGAAIKGC
jgi:hypothetical protein